MQQNPTSESKTARWCSQVALLVMVLVAGTGCSSYNDKRGRGDAPVQGGSGDDSPAQVYNFPDHFPNVATKCDGHGHRIFVVTHEKTDPAPTVIVDPTCPGGTKG